MIETIIFDFGDVFMNLDKPATERELLKLGVSGITESMYHYASQYEKGLITTENFTDFFRNQFSNISEYEFTHAWNAIILDFPEYRLEFIEQLSKENKFNLILLSNTNALHIEKVIETMGIGRYNRFKNCFDNFYLSHEIHLSKPHFEIFNFVLNENKIDAKTCLFIDDTHIHTETAAQLGINVWNINPKNEDITHLFKIKKELFK
jgi:glucose-1-phosphatase